MGSATLSGCQEAQILFFLKGKKNQWELSCRLLLVTNTSAWSLCSTWKCRYPLASKPFYTGALPVLLLSWHFVCNSARLRILGNFHTLFRNATSVPWCKKRKKPFLGIVTPVAALYTCFSFVIIFPVKIGIIWFQNLSIQHMARMRILGNVPWSSLVSSFVHPFSFEP